MGSVMSEGFGAYLHGCLVIIETVDKVVDVVIFSKYYEGKISNNPQESVFFALLVFLIVGFVISITRNLLSLHRIMQLCCTGNYSKDKTNQAIHFWMSLAKVWFEAFPQAIIAKLYFGNCATTDDMKIWGQAYGSFSMLPFIVFVFYLVYYSVCYNCCQKYEYDEEPNSLTVFAMFVTLILSAGCIFAAIQSIIAFNELCPPQL